MLTGRFQPVIDNLEATSGCPAYQLSYTGAWQYFSTGWSSALTKGPFPVGNALGFLRLGCSYNWSKTPVLWDGQQADCSTAGSNVLLILKTVVFCQIAEITWRPCSLLKCSAPQSVSESFRINWGELFHSLCWCILDGLDDCSQSRGVGFLCHPTCCVAGTSVQQRWRASQLLIWYTVGSLHGLASARWNVFGDLVQVIDEA